ncbi:aspartyl protease family protein [Bacteroidota bacterium]
MKNHISVFFLFVFFSCFSQGDFYLLHHKKKHTFSFKSINNLIIIPLEVNGEKGSFILDTGLSSNILFKAKSKIDSSFVKLRTVKLNGFGNGPTMDAIVTIDNTFRLQNIKATKQKMLIILDEHVNFSAKMGMTIDGMIGYEFFKNFIVKINFKSKKITVYDPKYFKKKTRKTYHTFPLQFHKYKPYITGHVKIKDSLVEKIPVKLLIDTGGSDSIWLFEDTSENLVPRGKYFEDFLGEGISGSIFGMKNKIEEFVLGDFIFEKPIVSFLNTETTVLARRIKDRNGSIGNGMLRRFIAWFDYGNKEITLKKNSHFKDKFTYNMSGLEINYNGNILVVETQGNSFVVDSMEEKLKLTNDFSFSLKPSYVIANVRKKSPGDLVGIQVGDVLLKVNHTSSYKMTFDEISDLFFTKKNKWVTLLVERNGKKLSFRFKLIDEL